MPTTLEWWMLKGPVLNFFNYPPSSGIASCVGTAGTVKVKFLHFFYIANMQFLNMHLLYTLILHSNDLNQFYEVRNVVRTCTHTYTCTPPHPHTHTRTPSLYLLHLV